MFHEMGCNYINHHSYDKLFQDEGWLLGIRKSDWNETRELKKRWGLFPANFTKELQ